MREDIIRMARESGYQHPDAVGACEDFAYFDLERFFHMAQAAEREACAKVCEQWEWANNAADAIRARGQA